MHSLKPAKQALTVVATAASLAVAASGALAHAATPTPAAGAQTAQVKAEQMAKIPCAKYLKKNHYYGPKPSSPLWPNTWKTDKQGRPESAHLVIRGLNQDPKPAGTCEKTVGKWAGPGYVGARMIPVAFKGTGQRTNVVPVTESAHRILMKAMEDAAMACWKTPSRPGTKREVAVSTGAVYKKNGTSVVPVRIDMSISTREVAPAPTFPQGAYLSFANKKYTKDSARKLTSKLAKDVKAIGCKTGR